MSPRTAPSPLTRKSLKLSPGCEDIAPWPGMRAFGDFFDRSPTIRRVAGVLGDPSRLPREWLSSPGNRWGHRRASLGRHVLGSLLRPGGATWDDLVGATQGGQLRAYLRCRLVTLGGEGIVVGISAVDWESPAAMSAVAWGEVGSSVTGSWGIPPDGTRVEEPPGWRVGSTGPLAERASVPVSRSHHV